MQHYFIWFTQRTARNVIKIGKLIKCDLQVKICRRESVSKQNSSVVTNVWMKLLTQHAKPSLFVGAV